jgi:hypothetical protein
LGLIDCRVRWGLSRRGWFALFVLLFALSALLFFGIYPFLSVSAPVPAEILVIEGWLGTPALKAAASHIRTNHYQYIFTTGGPVDGYEDSTSIFDSYAHRAWSRLIKLGIDPQLVTRVPAPHTDRNRTYASALALRSWMSAHGIEPAGLNVISQSVHSRRTRLLYQKAFASGTQIGIIAGPPEGYNKGSWWNYSAGVKDVIAEAAGYFYARLFFWPPPRTHDIIP